MHMLPTNLTFVEKVILILLFILVLLFYKAVRDLILSITDYFDAKRNHEEAETIELSINKENVTEIVDGTLDILDFCKSLITTQIQERLKQTILLNQRYEMRNLDVDAKAIAEEVYKSLNMELISNNSLIVNDDFILSYITSESLMGLLVFTKDYNNKFSKVE